MRFTIAFIIGRFALHGPSQAATTPVFSYRVSPIFHLVWPLKHMPRELLWPRCICVQFTLEWPRKMKSERDREGGDEGRARDWAKGRARERRRRPLICLVRPCDILRSTSAADANAEFVFALPRIRKHKAGEYPKSNVKGRIWTNYSWNGGIFYDEWEIRLDPCKDKTLVRSYFRVEQGHRDVSSGRDNFLISWTQRKGIGSPDDHLFCTHTCPSADAKINWSRAL